jgi:rhomboid protease GluP
MCVSVYVAMVCARVSPFWPSAAQLISWGAIEGVRVALDREYWRLATSAFVHGGLIHMGLNMWSLFVIGRLVERLYGNFAFAVLYLAAGIGGAIASLAASPVRVSVGASGAICGVLGALLAFLLTHRHTIPLLVLKPLSANAIGYIVFIVILGVLVTNIDQAAPLGGLAVGFVGGLLLTRPWPVVKSRWVGFRRILVSVAIAASLAGAAFAVARHSAMRLPPEVRIQHIVAQITPALRELGAIGDDVPSSLALLRDRADPAAAQTYLQDIERLKGRATNNLTRMRHATTSDPGLTQMVDSLIQAQTSQLALLEAGRRYLATGDALDLTGPDGFLARKAESHQGVRRFQQQQIRYLSDQRLLIKTAPPKP